MLRVFTALFLPVLLIPITSAVADDRIVLPDGISIPVGAGYDTLQAEQRATCLKVKPAPNKPVPYGQSVEYSLRKIDSYSSLQSEFGMNAAVSFRTGLWKGSSQMSYFSSQKVSSLSTFLMVRVRVRNVSESAELVIDPSLQKLKPDAFWRLCGDHYVSQVITGGEFVAIVEYVSHTQEELKDVRGKLGASVGNFTGASGNLEFSQKLSSIGTSSQKNIQIIRKGTDEPIPLDDIASILEYARTFPTKVGSHGKPYPYDVILMPYQNIRGAPDFSKLTIEFNKRLIEELSKKQSSAYVLASDIRYVLENPERFIFGARAKDLKELRARLPLVEAYTYKVTDAAEECFQPIKKCNRLADVIPSVTLPQYIANVAGCIAFDDNGICVKCRFPALKVGNDSPVLIKHGGTGYNVACSKMEPNQPVRITAIGPVSSDSGGDLWSVVNLKPDNLQSCGTCASEDYKQGGTVSISLNATATANAAGVATARLIAARCTGAGRDGCNLIFGSGFSIEIVSIPAVNAGFSVQGASR